MILFSQLPVMILLCIGCLGFPTQSQGKRDTKNCGSGLKITITPVNPAGFPIHITMASAENGLVNSWIDYSVANESSQQILRIDLRLIVVGPDGTVIEKHQISNNNTLSTKDTICGHSYIRAANWPTGDLFLVPIEVLTTTGVWKVDESAIPNFFRNRTIPAEEANLSSTFERNVTITKADEALIYELALKDLTRDPSKTKWLDQSNQLILLSESADFELPRIDDKQLIKLTITQIREAGIQQHQRLVYLELRPVAVEGSQVLTRLDLRDVPAHRTDVRVPFKYSFIYTFKKVDEKWVIDRAVGYPQG